MNSWLHGAPRVTFFFSFFVSIALTFSRRENQTTWRRTNTPHSVYVERQRHVSDQLEARGLLFYCNNSISNSHSLLPFFATGAPFFLSFFLSSYCPLYG
ncbi:hypothetical protein GQ42DRAFT_86298 [Ramicandelaber brevisporus]|nr:hypothetical protein GQ42DRAFT_89992 [Ramicandelaber brevisporus]KAI8865849.1 hypothetical protein GQ42DRAFT_86298 [Ramicandelaber brevisporus]